MKDSRPGRRLAFIGLGRMGFSMASHLARAGHRVRVHSRGGEKARRWQRAHPRAEGCRGADTVADAVRHAEMVMICVGDDRDVERVVLGEGGVLAAGDGRKAPLVIDHTTTSASLAQRLSRRAQGAGTAFLDAPVSGGEVGAREGNLVVMVGGDDDALARARPILGCYAARVEHMGPSGAGQSTKMVNQICVAGVLQGLAEGIDFARRSGLDIERALKLLGGGAGSSWQMLHRGSSMIEGRYDFGFAVDRMRKDLRICLEAAQGNGARLEITRRIDAFYAQLQAMGKGDWDTSSLLHRLGEASPRATARNPDR